MKYFKNETNNLIDIFTQQLWLSKNYENKELTQFIKDIFNENCEFLDPVDLNQKYKLNASFMNMLQIRSSIPSKWKKYIEKGTLMPKNVPTGNISIVNQTHM